MQRGLSIAIVAHNESLQIERLLYALLAQKQLPVPWEILLVDNQSKDDTCEVFKKFQAKNQTVQTRLLIHTPNHLGSARNFALNNAKYDALAFIDADCVPPTHWALDLFTQWEKKIKNDAKSIAVGSGNIPPIESCVFYRSLNIIFSSWFGHFNTMQAKPRETSREVSHLPTCNVFYHVTKTQAAGGFSDAFQDVCEDLELSLRAKKQGYRLFYHTGAEVFHYHTPGYFRWARKMFRYGRGQLDVARFHPDHLLGIKGAPLFLTLILAAIFWFKPLWAVTLLYFYLLLLLALSTACCLLKKEPRIIFSVYLLFLLTQTSYAMGEVWGVLVFFRFRKKLK